MIFQIEQEPLPAIVHVDTIELNSGEPVFLDMLVEVINTDLYHLVWSLVFNDSLSTIPNTYQFHEGEWCTTNAV